MEPAERISEEWSSLSGFYIAEEADFMRELLGNCSFPEEVINNGNSNLGISSVFWPACHDSTVVSLTGINDKTSWCSPNVANTNLFCFSQGSSSSSENNNIIGSIPLNFCLEDANISPYSNVEATEHLRQQINDNNDEIFGAEPGTEVYGDKNMQVDSEFDMPVSEPAYAGKSGKLKNSAKRSRSSIEAPKNKRNVKSKKNSKSASVNEEDRNPGLRAQSVSSCSSEDDSNASQDGGASSSLSPQDPKSVAKTKSRSTKGPATDPQSVYARKRRERINERLRILQNLVPNGTKVDISTMLEEAVQYVKFLQLQIKLLSSDDLWMYAPIAYNGMNIGLDLDITSTKRP